jgi:elongator complex protein 3
VVQGGTFPARDMAYQDWFVAGIYAALNDGPADAADALDPAKSAQAAALWGTEAAWQGLPAQERDRRLAALQRANESAACRAVGLTIETKPDWCFEPHLAAMLRHGATRVEIGLQCLDDAVLKATHRGHTLEDSRKAMRLARDAGFKVCVHMMPGLPRPRTDETGISGIPGNPSESVPEILGIPVRGTAALDPDPAADVEDMRRLFADPAFRPDMLKIYPTLVVMEGETTLKAQWRRGEFHPYGTEAATAVVAAGKSFVPEWCRIQRIDRDIPTTHLEAGVMNSNLRQLAQRLRAAQGLPACRCIRCREAGTRQREGVAVDPDRIALRRMEYAASGGTEVFLSLEDAQADAVVAFLRLRRGAAGAVVRELKVYGLATAIGDDDPEAGSFQHRGHGAALLAAAEGIAFGEWAAPRLLVIAGPGVKPYYRRHGYADHGPYVAKAAPGEGNGHG